MSMLYDTLMELTKRMESVEKELALLKGNAVGTVLTTSSDERNQVLTHLSEAIQTYWSSHQKPIAMNILSRNFSRTTSPFGGLRKLIPELCGETNSPCVSFITLRGTTLLFPRKAYEALSPGEITVFSEHGLTPAALNRMDELKVNTERVRQSALSNDAALTDLAHLITERKEG